MKDEEFQIMLNWKEKIIVKIFNKTFNKVYAITRIYIINKLL